MDRRTIVLLIALGLLGYGVYMVGYLPGLWGEPLLFVEFLVQAVLSILAAFATWRRSSAAGTLIVLVGVSAAATVLTEAILGIVAYIPAIGTALVEIVLAVVVAAFVGGKGGSPLPGAPVHRPEPPTQREVDELPQGF